GSGPGLRHANRRGPSAPRAVRAAVNQKMAAETAVLADGDELAFFPPVTGG
ncbi:MoaD/ThiS family protein, partial [Escherichia coli]|uniref:MoaD/ThiS family protein n=1 Tax=Escherichia coli TaxID=562 RepID=UPI0011215092